MINHSDKCASKGGKLRYGEISQKVKTTKLLKFEIKCNNCIVIVFNTRLLC